MMESVRHRTRALPAGVATSTLLHVLTVAYILFWLTKPPAIHDRPYDLSRAVPVMMEILKPPPKEKPPEPPPEPPKPQEPPKLIPTPDVIETKAAQQAIETPAIKPEPPKEEPKVAETPPPPPVAAPYTSYVRTVIEKEKRYPREALMSGETGIAVVYFVINRYGTVLAFRLEKRTGSSSLDAEVKRMMRRIQQFPAVPDYEFAGKDRIEFTLPIEFKLND